ncbi:vWA domain-containing protein [Microbacterium sp.]|uniref:vWA domain-containing protein n=1 Tax=Microbacterium sp. TaxID=51671 RepID=UPI0025E555B4|nr:vWA domain-containing protein [Microbacterium sp.]
MLDEEALSALEQRDPDAAMTLVAEMSGATDRRLRLLARALAGRIMVRAASPRGAPRPGIGRIRPTRWQPGVDIDVDESMDTLLSAALTGSAPDAERLRGPGWSRPATAVCLVVDRSGSMGGERLATAAVAAAAVALRSADDYSVIAFGSAVKTVKAQGQPREVERVVEDLLQLRGHGRTDLAAALRAATAQLETSRATRRMVLLLSDARSTSGDDPLPAARALDELLVLAPVGATESGDQARSFARTSGARFAEVAGPSGIPAAVASLWP